MMPSSVFASASLRCPSRWFALASFNKLSLYVMVCVVCDYGVSSPQRPAPCEGGPDWFGGALTPLPGLPANRIQWTLMSLALALATSQVRTLGLWRLVARTLGRLVLHAMLLHASVLLLEAHRLPVLVWCPCAICLLNSLRTRGLRPLDVSAFPLSDSAPILNLIGLARVPRILLVV